MGYSRAGFEMVGVDHVEQPRYPFRCVVADAMDFLRGLVEGMTVRDWRLEDFCFIHASPPCQRYSFSKNIHKSGDRHPDLVGPVRDLLERTGKPWVIENVVGAPMSGHPVELCGLMFGLRVLRHRLFESNLMLVQPTHPTHPANLRTGTQTAKKGGRGNGYSTGEQGLVCVAGHNFNRTAGARAMGIDWEMTTKELANAIPPAYTEYLGLQIRGYLS